MSEESFDIQTSGFPGTTGGKGDPGGNVMAIGLFVAAAALTIPGGTDVVRTAGHGIPGHGIADYVYDAAVDAAYVTANPLVSFVSANSRGFRLDASKGLSLHQTGAAPDSSALVSGAFNGTDNYPAYLAAKKALGVAGTLHLPQGAGAYRFTQPLVHTEGITLTGDGWHSNPGTVGVTTYVGIRQYFGTVLCFDADVAGLKFIAFTDNASNAPAFEYQSSTGSSVRNLMLYSGGGTGTTAHGIENFVVLNLDNVRVEGFAGCGVKTSGDGEGTANQTGNTALSSYRNVSCRYNKLHGFYVDGENSSVIHFLGCDAAENGGVGFLDKGPFGDLYASCHTALNNKSFGTPAGFSAAQRTKVTADWAGLSDQTAGSFVTTRALAQHVFSGCYSEVEGGSGAKAEILAPALVMGGVLAADTAHTTGSTALRLNGATIKQLGKIYADSSGVVELAKGYFDITDDAGAGWVSPASGGRFMWTTVLGLMLGGSGSAYDLGFRNSAGASVMLVPHNTTVPWFPDAITTDNGYQVGGTKVVGARGAAVNDAATLTSANATNAAAAPTQAEFNAFVAEFNKLRTDLGDTRTQLNTALARLRAHGLIAP